ncbi:MAG: phosphatidylglycerol lysyltransferase domain-containing protein, partial [Pyrinomonadaceae bacterium]
MIKAENPDIARARELILSHGWNSTSFQVINPGIKRWFPAKADAVVGYVSASKIRVVVGAPVCSIERLSDVVAEFEADASRSNENVCYFGAEHRLDSLLADSQNHTRFLLGAQSVWRPSAWSAIVAGNSSLRSQVNRAKNKGVAVSEWPIEKARRHPQLQECLDEWLDSKGLPPLHFMIETDTLGRLENRRVFVAEWKRGVAGFVVVSPVTTR